LLIVFIYIKESISDMMMSSQET